jgi:hypothetical protein
MSLPPIVVSVDVPVTPLVAHRLFTEGMGTWWPLASHSVFDDRAVTVRFPAAAGEPIVESSADGREATWGTVLENDPGSVVRFTWHPGRDAATAQEIEVRFASTDAGTHVTLTHDGWEASADPGMRAGYDTGWVLVLHEFVRTASPGA